MGFETPQEANIAYNHPVQPPSLSSSPVSHRRRSLAYTRSPPPPPNIPIPSIPDQLQDPSYPSPSISDTADHPYSAATSPHANGFPVRSMSYSRPSASPNLTTIAAFSHNLNVKSNVGMPSLPPDDLSDPPPQSFLPTSPKRAERKRRPSGEDGLLSPNPTGRKDRQPSSRSALTRALELARHAVHLDTTNDNPAAAVEAYAQSVSLLSQVMERVRRGEDGAKRTRSPEAQEEEVRRLQNIHDTYADRMNILSIIYSIPATPYTSLAYAATATSTSSASNSSSSSITLLQTTSQSHHVSSLPYYSDGRIGDHDIDSGEIMRQAMFPIDDVPPGPAHHPYANQYDTSERNTSKTQSRFSISASRRRAGSYLPPAAPPPAESLPPAPVSANIDSKDPPPEFQQGHKRNGSGRLLRLDEKDEGSPEGQVPFSRETSDSETTVRPPRKPQHDSLLLPHLHSPEANRNEEIGILRNPPKKSPPSPKQLNAPRSRASSQLRNRSNTPPHLQINLSPKEGAIYLRRAQTSAPSSVRSASPIESHSPYSGRPAATSLPGSTIAITATGRIRSSSQPGRKPSGQMSLSDQRPPLPSSVPQSGAVRKVSIPSKLNPNAQSSTSLTVQTEILSPTGSGSVLHTPGFSNAFVTTPTSPFPPAPPTDPLRKPYHMMNLLQITMTSATGGYLTPRLHIPFEVWSQGGAKLNNVSEKVRVVAIISSALEDLQSNSAEYFGAGNVGSGMAMGIGSVGRKEAEAWVAKLEDFSAVCDGIEANFSKKLGIGEGLLPKKNALTGLAKRIDKFTNGKNLDSPTAYVQGLKSLFQHAQLLDEHTQAVLTLSPAYVAFPADVRVAAEHRLRRFSEFFSTVVLSFVIRDLSQLLDKYVKKCEKWLEE